MAGLFKKLKSVVSYKPKASETFELLEDEYEGVERENTTDTSETDDTRKSKGKSTDKAEKRTRETKVPIPVEEWNKQKNEEQKHHTKKGMVSFDLKDNMEVIKKEFGIPGNNDIITREFKISRRVDAFIAYLDGMVDRVFISDFVIRQLMDVTNFNDYFDNGNYSGGIGDYICDNVIAVHEIGKRKDFNNIILQILNGDTALFIDGSDQCLLISTRGYEKRSVEKPVTENVVMGPQEGFTENLRTNISLIRKIIKNKKLVTETMLVGKTNNCYCSIMYIKGIVNRKVVNEVKRRIQGIDTSFILGDGMLGQHIEDNAFMIFPQALTTERPDRTASFLVEGKVAIITEGAPFAEIVPITFYHLLQTSEDSLLRWQYGTFLRFIRIFGVMISTFLPALYVAITLFHQEMIPTELLASIVRSKEEVPFPTIIEILILEISFELIREGGIRIPGVIGQTLGIIGALILGQSAVAANLVSPILIIIVAVTGLGSFAMPNYPLGLGLRIIRFFFTIISGFLGFYGISLGLFIIGCIACNMKSFGVPFFSPVAPKTKSSPDIVVRMPVWKQEERPDFLNPPNRKKQPQVSRKWKMKDGGGGKK